MDIIRCYNFSPFITKEVVMPFTSQEKEPTSAQSTAIQDGALTPVGFSALTHNIN